MKLLNQYSSFKLLLASLAGSLIIVYPNIACFSWYWTRMDPSQHPSYISFFFVRYFFIALLIWILLWYNLRKIKDLPFKKRLTSTFIIVGIGYLVYAGIACRNQPGLDNLGRQALFDRAVKGGYRVL